MFQAKQGHAAPGTRGPARARGSRIRIRCAFRKCKSKRDVKNISKLCTLQKEDIDVAQCRRLRKHCQLVRFCCVTHRRECLAPGGERGQRECLDAAQVGSLFQALLAMSLPWVAVIMLLQVVAGERGGCMCQARRRWLQNLSPQEACPPTLRIEKVNGKTKAREIPLAPAIAGLFHQWLSRDPPLHGEDGSYWPFEGQDTIDGNAFLFPGLKLGAGQKGRGRVWGHGVSSRAYLFNLRAAAITLQRERSGSREKGDPHPFDGYPLDKLGTHSFKRTGVTLMKDVCASTALVGAIAGTSARTLDKVYDAPTMSRKQQLVGKAFAPLATDISATITRRSTTRRRHKTAANQPGPSSASTGLMGQPACFCARCAKPQEAATWICCPYCKQLY